MKTKIGLKKQCLNSIFELILEYILYTYHQFKKFAHESINKNLSTCILIILIILMFKTQFQSNF